jgi:hypothetical protein
MEQFDQWVAPGGVVLRVSSIIFAIVSGEKGKTHRRRGLAKEQ